MQPELECVVACRQRRVFLQGDDLDLSDRSPEILGNQFFQVRSLLWSDHEQSGIQRFFGRRRRVRQGGYPSRAAAETALATLRAPARQSCTAAGWTTGQWLETWLAGRQSLRPSTRRASRQHLDCYLIPAIGRVPLAMLTARDVRAMLAGISRQRGPARAPVSAATLTRIRATIRAALNGAIREGLITANPASIVDLPAVPRPHPAVWTAARAAPRRVPEHQPVLVLIPDCSGPSPTPGGHRRQGEYIHHRRHSALVDQAPARCAATCTHQ